MATALALGLFEKLVLKTSMYIMLGPAACVIIYGVYGVASADCLKAMVLAVLPFWVLPVVANWQNWRYGNILHWLPITLVALLFCFSSTEVETLAHPGAVTVSVVFAVMIQPQLNMRSVAVFKPQLNMRSIAVVNFVITIVEISVLINTIIWSVDARNIAKQELNRQCDTYNFDFEGLTIGQVASASSAAAGGGAVRVWVQNVLEFARVKLEEAMGGLHCRVTPPLISQVFDQQSVKDELMTLLGCNESEHSGTTAERWSGFLRDMAVKMKVTNSTGGESRMSNMVIDAVGP